MNYLAKMLFAVSICFGGQYLALEQSGGRFTKNESNFFSSIGRIQAGARGHLEVAFLGSSLTGRLPDRSHGFQGVANMGCDGGSAIEALRAMDQGLLPVPPVIVIETNTMIRAVDPTPSMIAEAMKEPWFQVGRRLPLVSAYARPSGFFYSILLSGRIGSFETGGAKDLRVDTIPRKVPDLDRTWDDAKEALVVEVAGICKRLQSRGTKPIFVWLPPARPRGQTPPDWMLAMPARSNTLWWDVGQHADESLVVLTDGAHMAAPSAARTVRTILSGIESTVSED